MWNGNLALVWWNHRANVKEIRRSQTTAGKIPSNHTNQHGFDVLNVRVTATASSYSTYFTTHQMIVSTCTRPHMHIYVSLNPHATIPYGWGCEISLLIVPWNFKLASNVWWIKMDSIECALFWGCCKQYVWCPYSIIQQNRNRNWNFGPYIQPRTACIMNAGNVCMAARATTSTWRSYASRILLADSMSRDEMMANE